MNHLSLIRASLEPNLFQVITRAAEDKDVSFEEMKSAVEVLTTTMERLMALRERIVLRMRATGQLK